MSKYKVLKNIISAIGQSASKKNIYCILIMISEDEGIADLHCFKDIIALIDHC